MTVAEPVLRNSVTRAQTQNKGAYCRECRRGFRTLGILKADRTRTANFSPCRDQQTRRKAIIRNSAIQIRCWKHYCLVRSRIDARSLVREDLKEIDLKKIDQKSARKYHGQENRGHCR